MATQLIDGAETLRLNFTINDRLADQLADLDVHEHDRDQTASTYHREVQTTEARNMGRDPFRLGRTDSRGQAIPDSGRLMFGHEEAPGDAFTFSALMADYAQAGFLLVDVNIAREERRNRLFLNFRKGEPAMVINPAALRLIQELMAGWWSKLQGFRNPDASWNMNVRARLTDDRQINALADKRSVRMKSDGTFRLFKQSPASAPTAQ